MGFLVFPGAEHSRFTHAMGAMALMKQTLDILSRKGTPISPEERSAAMAAALLHDVGHAPFSHTLEFQLIRDTPHEAISAALMQSLVPAHGSLVELALSMFNGTYDRSFFHLLVASQLDMDRLDYLRRDSHFTGVMEGRIGVERILSTLRVEPVAGGPGSQIVVEQKGIYAIENMLIARRLMYWQVYLHRTVVAADNLLLSIIARVRNLMAEHNERVVAGIAEPLRFFLTGHFTASSLEDPQVREAFLRLDDADVIGSLKAWRSSSDRILADLCRRFLDRELFRCQFLPEPPTDEEIDEWRDKVAAFLCRTGLSTKQSAAEDSDHYLAFGQAEQSAYVNVEGAIRILNRRGKLSELSDYADIPSIKALTTFVEKPYVCFPKDLGFFGA